MYFKAIRRMSIAFGTVFNNINFVRENADGTIAQTQKVPLKYGAKQWWVSRINQYNTMASRGGEPVQLATTLPRMSFSMRDIAYAPNRQKSPQNVVSQASTSDGVRLRQTAPVPYDLSFDLQIYTKNTEDALSIVEQILPMFAPQLNIKIMEVDAMHQFQDINIKIVSVRPDDNFANGYEENRLIVWTISFVVQGNIYPPYRESKIIFDALVDFKNSFFDPATELETVHVSANQTDPPDGNKDNSTVTIIDHTKHG